jgi:hypothetical protein
MFIQVLRVEDKNVIIVQGKFSKCVWKVHLDDPIPIEHMAVARTITPFTAVDAKIEMGPYNDKEFIFENCTLSDINWPKPKETACRRRWF